MRRRAFPLDRLGGAELDFQPSEEGSANRRAGVFQEDLAPQKGDDDECLRRAKMTNASI